MQLEDSWLQQAGPGSEIAVLKPEREMAVRVILKGLFFKKKKKLFFKNEAGCFKEKSAVA